MGRSAADWVPAVDWVPAGAWLAPGYAEWAAPPPLRGAVACLWARVVPDGASRRPGGLVLPDGCSDLIWEQGVGAYVAGPDTSAVRTVSRPGAVFAGVRFRPAAGGPALGVPLSEIRDQRVALDDVLSAAARSSLAERRAVAGLATTALAGDIPLAGDMTLAGDITLAGDSGPAEAAALLLDLAGRLIARQDPDPAVARAAVLLRDPAVLAEDVAAEVGLSERHFRRRIAEAVGYGPKILQRVLRFQRFVQWADAASGDVDLATAAATVGYADQAHLTRECRALSGMTPAVLAQARGGAESV